MPAGAQPTRVTYDCAKLERDALELAYGCEGAAREALLEMAARYRQEASLHRPNSRKRLAILSMASFAAILLSSCICPH